MTANVFLPPHTHPRGKYFLVQFVESIRDSNNKSLTTIDNNGSPQALSPPPPPPTAHPPRCQVSQARGLVSVTPARAAPVSTCHVTPFCSRWARISQKSRRGAFLTSALTHSLFEPEEIWFSPNIFAFSFTFFK